MRKKNRFSLLIAGLVVLTGCDKFLDITPTGRIIPKTAQDFRELLTNAYSSVPSERGKASFLGDEIDLSLVPLNDRASLTDIWTWQETPSDETFPFEWKKFYSVNYIANYTIECEKTMEGGSAEEVSQLVGEAYMLRGYMHFLLAILYASPYQEQTAATDKGIPLQLSSNTELVLSRNSVKEVYESVLSDMNEAEKRLNVDTWTLGLNYRFNKASIEALRSRVYLYMNKWTESLTASRNLLALKKELTDFNTAKSLLPNHYTSPENIVALENVMIAEYTKTGYLSMEYLYSLYKTGDLRPGKYYKAETSRKFYLLKGGSTEFRCSFRTGEIYLNAAEAACQLNLLPEAKSFLYDLMVKRYNATGYANIKAEVDAMTKKENLLRFIYDERFRELAFEGHRWFDLRRTTRPEIVKTISGQTYILKQDDARYTVRIPADAIASNPNLEN